MLLQLAQKHLRWGFKKMYAVIKRNGYTWNHKRVRRIYCELRLNLRKKPKKRLPSRVKQILLQPLTANYCWSMDFMSDALAISDNWLSEYNNYRPHESLKNLAPTEFAIQKATGSLATAPNMGALRLPALDRNI